MGIQPHTCTRLEAPQLSPGAIVGNFWLLLPSQDGVVMAPGRASPLAPGRAPPWATGKTHSEAPSQVLLSRSAGAWRMPKVVQLRPGFEAFDACGRPARRKATQEEHKEEVREGQGIRQASRAVPDICPQVRNSCSDAGCLGRSLSAGVG